MQKVGNVYLEKRTKMSNGAWHGGKGCKPRPGTISKQYKNNWEKIFGKPKKDKDKDMREKE